MSKVCVILAAHNSASTIRAAVESIQNQSFTDWSLVAVDDASTDETYELLNTIATDDSRIRVFHLEKNRGLAYCLNFAIGQSACHLIARMDADDIALPKRLECQFEFLKAHPGIDVLGTAAETLVAGNSSPKLLRYPEKHEDLVSAIFYRNPFIHPSVVFRRPFIQAMEGYSSALRRAQDYDLWLRSYKRFRFHNLPDVLLKYRAPESISLRAAFYSALVIRKALLRERKSLSGSWFVLRPLVAYGLYRLRLKNN